MAKGSLGEAVLDLTADRSELDKTLKDTEKGVEGTLSKLKAVFSAILGSAVLQQIGKAYTAIVSAAEEAAVTQAKTAAVIRATGNAAGYTVDQLSMMADEFSRQTGFDDEMILNAEAVLLTFRQIGHDVFPQAMDAAIDMSAVLGQDLQSSVIQLGKALNDPIQGVTALRRVGVSFTDDQMDMIRSLVETNDLMGAQAVILDELNAEFGGAAQDMEEATTGSKRLNVSWGNLLEQLGEGLVPQQREWNLLLADTIDKIAKSQDESNDYTNSIIESAKELGYFNEAYLVLSRGTSLHSDEIIKNAAAIRERTAEGKLLEEQLADESAATEDLNASIQELDYRGLLSLTTSLADETSRFNERQADVKAKQAEIREEINTLIAQGWSPLSDKVQDLEKDYSDLGVQYDENAAKHKAASDKILYDLFVQKLSVDGLTQDEYEMALQFGINTGIIDKESVEQAADFDTVAQAVTDGKIAVEDMQKAIDLLHGKTIDIVIRELRQQHILAQGYDLQRLAGFASGTEGWATVPSGFPDDTFVIGLTSGERFNVVPEGEEYPGIPNIPMEMPGAANPRMQLAGDHAVTPIQFIYQPFIGVNDEYEAERKLTDIVDRINRKRARK